MLCMFISCEIERISLKHGTPLDQQPHSAALEIQVGTGSSHEVLCQRTFGRLYGHRGASELEGLTFHGLFVWYVVGGLEHCLIFPYIGNNHSN